jgi:hypothetical protein
MAKVTINSKAVKLLTLALDPAAQPGEISTAALKFVSLCRERKYTAETILESVSTRVRSGFTFGKFKGQPLDEVDGDYIKWALENLKTISPGFRRRLQEELQRRDR